MSTGVRHLFWPKSRAITEIAGVLVFLGLAAFASDASRFGIDFSDEGASLSSPWRFTAGDLPYRDELGYTMLAFDVILWPLFELFPELTVLQLRHVSIGIQLAAMLSFYFLLKRFAPAFLVALASSATAFLTLLGLWTPGYNLLSSQFLFLAVSLWLHASLAGSRRSRRALACIGGACAFLSAMSYLPLAATLAVPGLIFVYSLLRRRLDSAVGDATTFFLGTVAAMVAIFILVLAATDMARHWLAGILYLRGSFAYDFTLADKIEMFFRKLSNWVPLTLAVAGLLACTALAVPRKRHRFASPLGTVAVLTAGGLVWLLIRKAQPNAGHTHVTYCLMAAAYGLTLLSAVVEIGGGSVVRRAPAPWSFVHWAATSTLLLGGLMYGLASTNGFLSSQQVIGPIFTLGIVAMSLTLFRPADGSTSYQRALPVAALSVICIAFAAIYLPDRARLIYRDAERSELTATFAHPLLAGIRSTPGRVEIVEETLAFLDGKIEPGDRLLEYGMVPLFYYLTRTRPVRPRLWYTPYFPDEEKTEFLEHMIREEKVPEYCIVSLIFPRGVGAAVEDQAPWDYRQDDPVIAYVVSNYDLVKTVHPFQIWRRKRPKGGSGLAPLFEPISKLSHRHDSQAG